MARDRAQAKKIFNLFLNKEISSNFNQGLKSPKGSDQQFLAQYVYPLIKTNSITHDSYLCGAYGGNAFPTKRLGILMAYIYQVLCKIYRNFVSKVTVILEVLLHAILMRRFTNAQQIVDLKLIKIGFRAEFI